MPSTPLQIVKEKYASKQKLVEAVAGLVEPAEGESAEDHQERLARVSNAKLLHLLEVGEAAKAAGGKSALIDAVAELRGHQKDADFKTKLGSWSLSRLLDEQRRLARKASKSAKK